MREIFNSAMLKPMPPIANKYYLPKMRMLVALVFELQLAAGEKSFFVSCRDAGALIKVDFRRVSAWLRKLQADGVLQRISTGSMGTHKANKYRLGVCKTDDRKTKNA
jgi:hypothetical protein